MKKQEELLTVPNIAKKLKLSPQYVRRLISENKLQARRIGTQWVVKTENLMKYLADDNIEIGRAHV